VNLVLSSARAATYCDLVPRSPLFLRTKTEHQRTTFAGVGRILIGVALLFPTSLSLRLFGIPEEYDNAALRAMGRLFGIRDIALGLWALAVRDQPSDVRKVCYRVNAAVDAADICALTLGAATSKELRRAAAMSSAFGGSGLIVWIDLIRDLTSLAG
jgi:hypothetical protein